MATFDDLEISNYGAEPIMLYEFLRVSGGVNYYWRYVSGLQIFEFDGSDYHPTVISDSGVTQSGEAASSQFTVKMPIDEAFPQMYRNAGSVPSDQVWLTVRRVHGSEPTDARVYWRGTVAGLNQTNEIEVEISCNVLTASFQRPGLRLAWSRTCPHAVYDSQCKANPDAAELSADAVVEEVNGVEIVSVDFAGVEDGFWDGGWIEWFVLATGLVERRWIKNHIGDTITLASPTFGLTPGDLIHIVAGCDHLDTTCEGKFGNITHYGGFKNMPGKSPFSGEPIF